MADLMAVFEHKTFPEHYNYLAPDTSEIRILFDVEGAGLAHCILPAGKTSRAVRHQTVNEIWYVISGSGEIWQGLNDEDEFALLNPGVCLTIKSGTSFQFRNTGTSDLCILITTAPNWPGAHEAVDVQGFWKDSLVLP